MDNFILFFTFFSIHKKEKNGFLNELRLKRVSFKNHVLYQYRILVALYIYFLQKIIQKSHKFDIKNNKRFFKRDFEMGRIYFAGGGFTFIDGIDFILMFLEF
jgi:hypothetical protein